MSAVTVLQVISHYTLINVRVPTSAQAFYGDLFQIVAFDFYDTSDDVTYMFQLENSDSFSDNFNSLGY